MTGQFWVAIVSAGMFSLIAGGGAFAHDGSHDETQGITPKISKMGALHHGAKSNTPERGKMGRDEIPKNLDKSSSKFTNNKVFKTSLTARETPISINVMQAWVLKVSYPDDHSVDDAKIIIFGGMPTHGHGFPTAPRVTKNLGRGEYLIEGVQFNMPGWWEMKFQISDGRQNDTVIFNLVLPH
ncbi:MAG: hypothetical protein ACJAU6_004311 [Alphaproteobacteria bacterium]|jgi:hypothetical protein